MLTYDIATLLNTYKLLRLDNAPLHCYRNDTIMFKYIGVDDDYPSYEPIHVAVYAVIHGHFNMFKWLYYKNISIWALEANVYDSVLYRILVSAASYDQLYLIKWLYKNNIEDIIDCLIVFDMVNIAAKHNRFETLKWICMNSNVRRYLAMSYAAEGGHLDIMKWIYDNDFEHGSEWIELAAEIAAYKDHIHILEWLQQFYIYTYNESYYAALHGRTEVLIWLEERGLIYTTEQLYINIRLASQGGYFETVKWYYNKYDSCDDVIIRNVIYSGNYDLVKWLYSKWPEQFINADIQPSMNWCSIYIKKNKIIQVLKMLYLQ